MNPPSKLVRFLLVEDDDDHAELVVDAMNENRILNDVTHVSDGAAALAFLRQETPFEGVKRPDVILLDLNLPKLNGHEVLERIKSDEQLSAIPVVILTTSRAEEDRHRAYTRHANSYLVKPVDFAEFNDMVRDLGLYWGGWNERPA